MFIIYINMCDCNCEDCVTGGNGRNAGYIKLLLSKYHYKRGKDDFEPDSKYRPDRKMDKNFYYPKMKPPTGKDIISEWIEKRYGKKKRIDKGQKRNKNLPKTQAQNLNRPFTKLERQALSPEELAIVRNNERLRKQRSLAKRGKVEGYGAKPPEKTFYDVVKQGYKAEADANVDGMDLILNSPTVKAYVDRNAKTIMIVSRGTVPSDTKDLSADASIAYNGLKNTDRYKTDQALIANLVQQYPPTEYDYFMTGHSLGGATTAQLKRDFPFIKDAVVYNPASQPYDFVSQQSNQIKRIYTEDDPLYALGGTFMTNKQVIPTTRSTIKTRTGTIADYGIKANNFLQGHALDNFNTLYGGFFHRKGDGSGTKYKRGGANNFGNRAFGGQRADAVNAYLANQLYSSPLYTNPNYTF
jgi:hypothetical protein